MGQLAFGVGLGVLTMTARCNPFFVVPAGAVYWAILAMNTLVPLIDRLTRRTCSGQPCNPCPINMPRQTRQVR